MAQELEPAMRMPWTTETQWILIEPWLSSTQSLWIYKQWSALKLTIKMWQQCGQSLLFTTKQSTTFILVTWKASSMCNNCIQYKKAKWHLKQRQNQDWDSNSESESFVEERLQKRNKGKNKDSKTQIMTIWYSDNIVDIWA